MESRNAKEKEFPEFKCKRCGKCCKEAYILLEITKEEWIPIIEFVKDKYNGLLKIKDMDYPSQYEIYDINNPTEFFKGINYSQRSHIFWALDNGKCPFIKKRRKGPYYCEIYEIRPEVCRNFRCDLDDDDFMIYLDQLKELKKEDDNNSQK